MLEYSKIILKKVSFNSVLFEKELKKSLGYLLLKEIEELFSWVRINHVEYRDILDNVQNLFFQGKLTAQ
jgi:hypothetical protein